jgi:hypothetical protein
MLKTVSSITNAIGALNYKGTWNASTNTPTLADGTGAKGDYYVVSTAGTQTFGGVQLFFGLGDWIVYNGAVWQRVEGGSDGNFANVTLTSTDAGANEAPTLDLYRDSASPTAADTLAEIQFNGEDSAGNKQKYACIHGSILSPTSGSEQGQIHFETQTAGASTEKMIIGTTNLVINEIGAVFNVRIEGDTDANLFYTDATNDRIGVGTASPSVKLDVVGAIKTSTTITATGAGSIEGLTVGRGAGAVSTNTAVGSNALAANSTGAEVTAIGRSALAANTVSYGTAVGANALTANTTGAANSAFGAYALASNTTGSGNCAFSALGFGLSDSALQANTTGNYNSAFGLGALSATTDSNNTGVGFQAGYGLTTGSSNTYIGYLATQSGVAVTNEIVVGANITGKGSNTAFIGGTSGAYNGANSATWSIISDERIKKNIVDVASGLDKILALRSVEFEYKENDKHDVGFISQEYQLVFPSQVITHAANEAQKQWVDDDGMVMGINQNLVPYLVKAIQELKAEFDAYRATHP